MTSQTLLVRNTRSIAEDHRRRLSLYPEPQKNYIIQCRENLNLSQAKLAAVINCTKLVILKTEQGTYPNIPPVLMHYWTEIQGESWYRLSNTYEDFQLETRRFYSLLFLDLSVNQNSPTHPLKQIMQSIGYDLSINEISKRMCVAQSTIQYWVTKWKSQQTVPVTFAAALTDMGYEELQVQKFCRDYENWRELHK